MIKKICDDCGEEFEEGNEFMSLDEEYLFHLCKKCIEKIGLDDA